MPQFFLIGEAAKQAGLSSQTVRDYCRQDLVKPIRDSAGRRLFTPSDVCQIREVYLARMNRAPLRTRQARGLLV